ncbi:MAG: hypothetical protein K8S25_04520 [Alphaproteobacteria bacterium]|nr:hypothetical protein [Alphaproteobacteria bacterium]
MRHRERRHNPQTLHAWRRQQGLQGRARHGWAESGIAISFRVELHEAQRVGATDNVADTFRSAGFIVLADGFNSIVLIGEPCLALAFMYCAANAGKLCQELEYFLSEVVGRQSLVREEVHTQAVTALSRLLATIELVGLPRREATACVSHANEYVGTC